MKKGQRGLALLLDLDGEELPELLLQMGVESLKETVLLRRGFRDENEGTRLHEPDAEVKMIWLAFVADQLALQLLQRRPTSVRGEAQTKVASPSWTGSGQGED